MVVECGDAAPPLSHFYRVSLILYLVVRVCVCVRYWFYLFDEREDRPYSAAAFCTVVVMVNEGGDSVKNL